MPAKRIAAMGRSYQTTRMALILWVMTLYVGANLFAKLLFIREFSRINPLLQVAASRQARSAPVCCATARRLNDGGSLIKQKIICCFIYRN